MIQPPFWQPAARAPQVQVKRPEHREGERPGGVAREGQRFHRCGAGLGVPGGLALEHPRERKWNWKRPGRCSPHRHGGQGDEQREDRLAPVVVAEDELLDVPVEVLAADAVVSAVQAPLDLAPEAFDGVGVDLTAGVLAVRVVDRLVASGLGHLVVQRRLVAVQRGPGGQALVEELQRG